MAKGHKHIKHLKSEKAKVKLKAKKVKQLPKGLNVTDTTFKVKKIVIREQFKEHDEAEILSKRKLNVKDLLARLQHHNSTVRQEAVRELKDILLQHPLEILSSQLSPLLQGISALSLDKERNIRKDSLKVLNFILSPISNEQLAPFCDILISYLRCAMTHIDPNIKEDSLLFLDVLVQNCSSILAKSSDKVLPNFLDMISRMHTETKPGRQLTITLNSKNTSVKWRIKVLERLSNMLGSVINYKKLEKAQHYTSVTKVIHVTEETKYIPLHRQISDEDYKIKFDDFVNFENNTKEKSVDADELIKYISVLMPLMFDSWIEVCPEEKITKVSEMIISNEASYLLKHIVVIIQLIIEYIDIIDNDGHLNIKTWFQRSFQSVFIKNLFSKFPYTKMKTIEKFRKRQEDFSELEMSEKCLEQNLAICQIYTWFTSVTRTFSTIHKLDKKYCKYVVDYVNERITNWASSDNLALPQLNKLLRTLFFKGSKVWYASNITMEPVLKTIINASSYQPKRELQAHLYNIITDIMLDHTLIELQSEHVFKEFVSILPNLLLRPSIHESMIQMINRAVLRHRKWMQDVLVEKQDVIIANAKIIQIIGTEDEKRSRLMICNLFYFLNEQIYY